RPRAWITVAFKRPQGDEKDDAARPQAYQDQPTTAARQRPDWTESISQGHHSEPRQSRIGHRHGDVVGQNKPARTAKGDEPELRRKRSNNMVSDHCLVERQEFSQELVSDNHQEADQAHNARRQEHETGQKNQRTTDGPDDLPEEMGIVEPKRPAKMD